jgi:polysaccharide pyruvyl transferase WcaK-like protein
MMFGLLLLDILYRKTIPRGIMHGIWSVFSIITLWLFCRRHKNFFYHYGLFGKNINAGDSVLYKRLEKIFDGSTGRKHIWYHRLAFGTITSIEVTLINKYCKALIVGGHGLLMPDSNTNANSGWGFNITISNLRKINVPLVFFAVGYNAFRGADNFIPVFGEHLKICLEKSIFFGLRNYGSVNAVKKHIPAYLHGRIVYQPCPTTMTALYSKEAGAVPETAGGIAVSVAFNRFKSRFGNNYREVFDQLIAYSRYMKSKGYAVSYFGHHILDTRGSHAEYFRKRGFPVFPLYALSEDKVYACYRSRKLIIGMRGHSLMIPFGLSIPVLSLTNHDKQKWFIETTGHNEWNIEMNGPFYDELIKQTFVILEHYDHTKREIMNIQKRNRELTEKNIGYIQSATGNGGESGFVL